LQFLHHHRLKCLISRAGSFLDLSAMDLQQTSPLIPRFLFPQPLATHLRKSSPGAIHVSPSVLHSPDCSSTLYAV